MPPALTGGLRGEVDFIAVHNVHITGSAEP